MVESQRVVRLEEIDSEFSRALVKALGTNLYYCFQCGTCTASCPVFKFDENYNPRAIVRSAVLGLTNRVLDSDLIWLCAACNSCTERCPRGVRPSDVIRAIRNIAVERGYIHKFYKDQATAIVNHGRIWEDEEIVNELREDVDLPPISPVYMPEVAEILENTKLKELLATEKGGRKE